MPIINRCMALEFATLNRGRGIVYNRISFWHYVFKIKLNSMLPPSCYMGKTLDIRNTNYSAKFLKMCGTSKARLSCICLHAQNIVAVLEYPRTKVYF